MNRIDREILRLLQQDATVPIAELAESVGLSKTACWRRVQNLERGGVIRRRVALCSAEKLNVGVTAFVAVKTDQHNIEWARAFTEAVEKIDQVVEFYRMSGSIDYLLRVVVPDIAAYHAVYERLIQSVSLADVSGNFAIETLKYTTALPTEYAE